jgi:hypothetical protein
MKIRMLVSIAGKDFALSAGDETERFGDGEAVRLIEAGSAMPISEQTIERTVKVDARETRKGKRD